MFPSLGGFAAPATIRLPLSPDRCSTCNVKGRLLLCSSCLDVGYCGAECQKKHWKEHKPYCKKHEVDKVDLASWYPLIVYLCARSHMDKDDRFKHPALGRKVLNSTQEQTKATGRISVTRTLELGPPCHSVSNAIWDLGPMQEAVLKVWWPKATSITEACRLVKRIKNEKGALLGLVSSAFGLLASMYVDSPLTATANGKVPRLMLGKQPIVDFGISRGKLGMGHTDRLQYHLNPEDKVVSFQDPDIHYWIYFTNAVGEVAVLDCNCLQYGVGVQADVARYEIVDDDGTDDEWEGPNYFASWFMDNTVAPEPTAAGFHTQQQWSVLRDPAMKDAALAMSSFSTLSDKTVQDSVAVVARFMDRVSADPVEPWQKELLRQCVARAITVMRDSRQHNKYLKFPKHPSLAAEWRLLSYIEDVDSVPRAESEEYKIWCKDRKQYLKHMAHKKGNVKFNTIAEAERSSKEWIKKRKERTGR